MRSAAWLAAALLAGALAAGCASAPTPPPLRSYSFAVGPDDVLSIEVFGETELTREVTVTPDGYISFPLLGTTLKVLDQSIHEVARAVHTELLRTMTNPTVTVTLVQARSAQVHVWGEVGRQGPVPYRHRLSLVHAIGVAGGVSWPFAKTEAVHIVRGSLSNPQVIAVDLDLVLDGEAADVYLQPGDIVLVPAKWVTRFDRYVRQLLSPLTAVIGGGTNVATTAATVP